MGRPTKLTPELQDRLCQVIREGHYVETALQAVGISRECLSEWRDRARTGEIPYSDFVDEFAKAEAEAELGLFGRVIEASKLPGAQGWLPAITALERRHPDRYGRRDRLDVEHHSIKEVHVEVSFKPPPLVVDGSSPPLEVVEGEVRELGPGDSLGQDYVKDSDRDRLP